MRIAIGSRRLLAGRLFGFLLALGLSSPLSAFAAVPPGLSLYSIGNPTDEEQLYVELINRARSDPAAEGRLLKASSNPDVLSNYQGTGVDLDRMVSQFAQISPAPPLSISAQLTAAARLHSQDMLTNGFQAHEGSDGGSFGARAQAQGYVWSAIGENVFAYATSVEEGHTAFEVDWGGDASTGGMQDPPGHRLNIHDPKFREIGPGVVHGVNGKFGPQSVTEDFAVAQNNTVFITGVVYYDVNGNGSYDAGEGVGGVMVVADGADYYGISAGSGGYSIPVAQSGEYAVTFSLPGTSDVARQATVSATNVKVDHRMTYVPPTVSGPDQPAIGFENIYSFGAVPGATGYQWQDEQIAPASAVDGAEDGLTHLTANISPGYSAIDDTVSASGQSSFHLAHPQPESQSLLLNRTLRGRAGASLSFASKLTWATSTQIAHVQISVDSGATWRDVWTQAGQGDSGDPSFSTQTIPLSDLANQEFTVRFFYEWTDGTFFPQTDSPVGWHIDDISFSNTDEILDRTIANAPSTASFAFTPPQSGSYLLSVRPVISGRAMAWGAPKAVTAVVDTPPTGDVRIVLIRSTGATGVQIDFSIGNGAAQAYQLQGALDPAGPWTTEPGATIANGTDASSRRALVPLSNLARRFFRVVAQ